MDLSSAGITDYWRDKGGVLSAVLESMGKNERWVLVGEHAARIQHLWEIALDDPVSVARMTEEQRAVVELLGWLSSEAAIRIVEHLERQQFGAAAALAMVAESNNSNPLFRVFIDRLVALSRAKLLWQVFSPERMALVDAAIRQRAANEEEDGN